MNKLMKFFIICAITFVVGLGLCIGGVCKGGVEGIDKVAEHKDWLEGSPGDMQTERISDAEFDSVELTGQADLVLVGTEYTSEEADWHISKKVSDVIKENMPEEGTVVIAHGENIEAPDCKIENGVLKINGGSPDDGAVTMNFSPNDGDPGVIVFCGDRKLKNITVSNNYCDVALLGIAFENAKLAVCGSDVFMECVRSAGLKVDGDCSDISLHGDFYGNTDVATYNGDVKIESSIDKADYGLDIVAKDGDIELDNGEIEIDSYPWKYSAKGGPNNIKVRTTAGDVEIFFGDTLY